MNTTTWKHRDFAVTHSYRGFTLEVRDHPAWRWTLGAAAEEALGLAGHPCCGRGLGRIDVLCGAANRLLNAIVNFQFADSTAVASLHLSAEQAVALAPRYAEDIGPNGWITVDGVDEDGDVYEDARLVAVRCPDCEALIDASGRWYAKVLDEHTCADR